MRETVGVLPADAYVEAREITDPLERLTELHTGVLPALHAWQRTLTRARAHAAAQTADRYDLAGSEISDLLGYERRRGFQLVDEGRGVARAPRLQGAWPRDPRERLVAVHEAIAATQVLEREVIEARARAAWECRKAGVTSAELAETLGVSRESIYAWVYEGREGRPRQPTTRRGRRESKRRR